MFTGLVVMSVIGIVLLSGEATHHESTEERKLNTEKYSKEWFRNELSIRHYSDWDCHDIAWQMRDNWIKDDFERLLRNNYTVEYAIDELISRKIINL